MKNTNLMIQEINCDNTGKFVKILELLFKIIIKSVPIATLGFSKHL